MDVFAEKAGKKWWHARLLAMALVLAQGAGYAAAQASPDTAVVPDPVAGPAQDAVPPPVAVAEQPLPPETRPEPQPETQPEVVTPPRDPLTLLGSRIAPGKGKRLLWVGSQTLYGDQLETPVYAIHGQYPGTTLCLTGAIHGDELNGVEIVRQIITRLDPKELHGTVIGVPIVNLLGFTRGSRYLPDRRDLNRFFPGNPDGSAASRIARSFFEEIVRKCDLLIDLHTGSLNRTNMAQVRANLNDPAVVDFTTRFGSTAVLHSRKLKGNLRSAASSAGIPAVALELGQPGSLQPQYVEEGVEIVRSVLDALKITHSDWSVSGEQPVFYSSRWVRVDAGGLLIADVNVGDLVREGDTLGTLVNPVNNHIRKVVTPHTGRVLGKALNQFMLPGYAAFHIGIVASEAAAVDDAGEAECESPGEDAADAAEGCHVEDEVEEAGYREARPRELEDEEES